MPGESGISVTAGNGHVLLSGVGWDQKPGQD